MRQIFATKFCGKNTHFFGTNNVSFSIMAIVFSAKNVARNATKNVTHPSSLFGWLDTKPNFSQWTVTTPYTQYWKWYVIGYDKNAIFANPLGVIFSSSEGCLKSSPLWWHIPRRGKADQERWEHKIIAGKVLGGAKSSEWTLCRNIQRSHPKLFHCKSAVWESKETWTA